MLVKEDLFYSGTVQAIEYKNSEIPRRIRDWLDRIQESISMLNPEKLSINFYKIMLEYFHVCNILLIHTIQPIRIG